MPDLSAAQQSLSDSRVATPGAVREIRNAVVAYATTLGMESTRLDDVRLAVSEAVTNVVMHAYPHQPGPVHLLARVTDHELWVLIADDGVGSNVPPQHPGLGLGLALIARVTDGFALVERAGGGTEARMRFQLTGTDNVIPEDR